MDPITPLYFDVMPVHEPPKRLESLTSFLTRLGEGNGLQSINELSALCFPGQDRRITRHLADYPPLSLVGLAAATACPETALLATTFYHVADKFGRSSHPQDIRRFLNGNIAGYLRYCPMCLAEHGSYSLTWRFLPLGGCTEHHCRLLDRCGHCGSSVPLLQSPFRLGTCSYCGGDLRSCLVESISEEESQSIQTQKDDLEFLLSPLPWERMAEDTAAILPGRRLGYLRRLKGLSVAQIADQTGQSQEVIRDVEKGAVDHVGATYRFYVRYAGCLGLTLQQVFCTELPAEEAE